MSTVTLTDTDVIRVSTEAGEHFVDAYYNALNTTRHHISSFYIPAAKLPSGRDLPYLNYNGEVQNDPAAFQQRFESQMPWTHFEPQSVDVHVMNPVIAPIQTKSKKEQEMNMALLVQVSGFVRYHERKEGPMRAFSDSFVLMPNKDRVGGVQTSKNDHGRKWLIQTQNFRIVV